MTLSVLESPHNCDFKVLLLEAVDAALSPLGDSSKHAIYFYLEKNFTVKRQDIPNKIEEFTNAIEEIFGYGARILETEIMKQLYLKIGNDFEYYSEKDDLIFVEYIDAVRKRLRT